MSQHQAMRRTAIAGVTLIAALPLAACGGGGGGVQSTPTPPTFTPVPPPPPPPPPPPTPPPTSSSYSQQEYEDSNGPASINAAAAYAAGATGLGVLVGVVDSGIDQNQPEFAGRISPLSRDFAGNPTVQDVDGHGTAVAGVIAAAANNRNTLGVAFNATILALRTDEAGSCVSTGDDGGCKHPDSAIGAAIDFARVSGAKVINISLGGGAAGASVRNAIERATAQGIIIVISAGNDGDETRGTNPDPFAQVAIDQQISRGLVIIAGALSETNVDLAAFSDKAGIGQNVYLAALGEKVRTVDNENQAIRASGTSFSAPVISGAIALIRQAFPNLSGAQVVDLIYRTARDLGAPGVDPVFGRGGLDLTRAFQPQGQMTLAGSGVVLGSLDGAQLGSAMGDGGRLTGFSAVALDSYGRAFDAPVLTEARAAAPLQAFASALRDGPQAAGLRTGAGGLLAVSVEGANGARPLALRQADAIAARTAAVAFVQRLSSHTVVSLGVARGAEGLTQRLDAAQGGAFLLAGRADGEVGLMRDPDTGVAVSHDLGRTRLTMSAETGRALTTGDRLLNGAGRGWDRTGYTLVRVGAERPFGPAVLSLAALSLNEDATVLGARLGPVLGAGRGGASWFMDAGGSVALGDGWRTAARYRRGWSSPRAGGALTGGTLASDAWSFDLSKSGLWGRDLLSLRLSQPLRVVGGGLNLSLPSGYDYATLATTTTDRTLDLRPVGAERVAEAAYARALWGGSLSVNGYWRTDPGNNAARPDDRGALLRWSAGF